MRGLRSLALLAFPDFSRLQFYFYGIPGMVLFLSMISGKISTPFDHLHPIMAIDKIYWIITTGIFLADPAIRIGLSMRVLMRKRAPSVTLAWLAIIVLMPFLGAAVYLLLGENRIGEKRARCSSVDLSLMQSWAEGLNRRAFTGWRFLNPECDPIHRQIDTATRIPTMPGNSIKLIECSDEFFDSLIRDIDRARISCLLEFYIWTAGGKADLVCRALVRASQRGVRCRILLDSIGSKDFLRSRQRRELEKAGIKIAECMPADLGQALFVRIDLRNHRKIICIDGCIGYTGSQNLVDPKFFKQDRQVGEWVDIMVRIRGPVVEIITAFFLNDGAVESGEDLEQLKREELRDVPEAGPIPVQPVPSGPGAAEETIHDLLLTTIYAARRELILTTPYFVPDKPILTALKSAAQRGVCHRSRKK